MLPPCPHRASVLRRLSATRASCYDSVDFVAPTSRLDEPEAVAGGESLAQELGALNPWQRSEVVAGELEQIEGNRCSLPAAAASAWSVARHAAAKSWTARPSWELRSSNATSSASNTVARGDSASRSSSEPRRSRRLVPWRDQARTRPGGVDRHEQPEPVPIGLHHPVTLSRPRRRASAKHWLGDRHRQSVEPRIGRLPWSGWLSGPGGRTRFTSYGAVEAVIVALALANR